MFFFGFVVWLPRPKFFEAPFNASACEIISQIHQLKVECVGAKEALTLMDRSYKLRSELLKLKHRMNS